MPGKYDLNSPADTYLSSWFIHRSVPLNAVDDLAHPEAVLQILDFSKSFQAFGNSIWVTPVRFSGAGTITVTLVYENTGSVAAWQRFTVVDAVPVASGATLKFIDLLAGKYRLLVTGSSGVWNLHVATSMPPDMCSSVMETAFTPMLATGQLWLLCSDGFYYKIIMAVEADGTTITYSVDQVASEPPLYGLPYLVMLADNGTRHKVTLMNVGGSVYLDVDQQNTIEAATLVNLATAGGDYYSLGLAYKNGIVTTQIGQTPI